MINMLRGIVQQANLNISLGNKFLLGKKILHGNKLKKTTSILEILLLNNFVAIEGYKN